jgi:hypothetical protein|tara:strand:- start:468 stop:581 length:114 start_codon:yes stop_codon:yes gene_type:complete
MMNGYEFVARLVLYIAIVVIFVVHKVAKYKEEKLKNN